MSRPLPKIQVLFSRDEIQRAVQRVATEVYDHYRAAEAKEVTLVFVLTGAFMFLSDLIRALEDINAEFLPERRIDWRVDRLDARSYVPTDEGDGRMKSSGEVRIVQDVKYSLRGKHVLVIEDVADKGMTLTKVVPHLAIHEPASLNTAVLLRKPNGQAEIPLRFVAIACPDVYVVGYGLDSEERFRGLPFIGQIVD